MRAEAAQATAHAELDRVNAELAGRSTARASEKEELYYLRHRVKGLVEKNNSYEVRSNRKFFEVEPFQEENESLLPFGDSLSSSAQRRTSSSS